jgi:ribosomal protein S6
MFLLDAALASDWPAAEAEVKRILERADAKVLGLKNWDERKLAFPVRAHKRGLYVLTYFEAPAEKIEGIERDVHLSEKAVRVLVLRRDKITPEKIQAALTAAPPPKASFRGPDEWGPPRGPRMQDSREPDVAGFPDSAVALDDGPADGMN